MAPRGTRVSPEPQPQSSGPRKTLCPQQDPALPWAREKQTAPAWCNLVSTLLQGENGRKITFFLQNLEKINLDLTFVSNPLYVNVPQVEQMPWAAKLFQTRNPHGLNSAGGKKAPGCARRSLVQPQTTSHLWSGTPEDTELTAHPEKIEIKHHNSCPSHWSNHPFLAAFWKIQPFCVVLVKHFDGKKKGELSEGTQDLPLPTELGWIQGDQTWATEGFAWEANKAMKTLPCFGGLEKKKHYMT